MGKGGQIINLNRFESQVNATILKRGKDYYEEGLVKKSLK